MGQGERGFAFSSKQQVAGAGRRGGFRTPAEARQARSFFNGSSIALDLQKCYSIAVSCQARMTSTPAPTASAATKTPPAIAAEIPKTAVPIQTIRAAPSEKLAAYMVSAP